MRTTAIQQELMDAALACGDAARDKFNAFQTGFGPELRRSDKTLLDMFHRVKGFKEGEAAYNLFKTELASRAELRRLRGNDQFCALADQTVSDALTPDRPTLAAFVNGVAIVDTQGAVTSCGLMIAEAGIVPMPKPAEIAALERPVATAPETAPAAAAPPTVVASLPAEPAPAAPKAAPSPIGPNTALVPATTPEPAPPTTTRMSAVAVVVPEPNPVEVAATYRNAATAQTRSTMAPVSPKKAAAIFVPSPKPLRLAALVTPSPDAAPDTAQTIMIVPRPNPSRTAPAGQ